ITSATSATSSGRFLRSACLAAGAFGLGGGDAPHVTATEYALVVELIRRAAVALGMVRVVALDQQPVPAALVLLPALALARLARGSYQGPGTFQLLAVKHEVDFAGLLFAGTRPFAMVPYHHGAAAVLSLW